MPKFLFSRCRNQLIIWTTSLVLVMCPFGISQAGTIVRISTSVGDYSIELLDEITPITVQNFLNYVNRDAFDGTYLHRVVDNFVVQGGGFRVLSTFEVVDVVADPPILNEFNVSNTRGTVAMAKLPDLPDSATSQWFVSLADNSANLDNQSGGFTVFGNVLGGGMAVLDAIDDLPFLSLGLKAISAPYFTETYTNGLDLVAMSAEVVSRFSEASHVFEDVSGVLITSIDVDNGGQLASVNLSLVPSEPGIVFQVNPASVVRLAQSFDGIATYSTADNRLRLPSLEVSIQGTISMAFNVVFVLSDAVNLRFTLESFSMP